MNQYATDKRGRPVQAPLAWILAVVTLGYLLPWAIAATRGKSNAGAIFIINFLLGWTVIGWVVSLVMACGAHQVAASPTQVIVQQPSPSPAPAERPPTAGPPPAS